MPKSVLAQLYNGEIYPAEQAKPHENQYTKASESMGSWKEKLYASFTPEQQSYYERMAEFFYIVTDNEHTAIFSEGFSLGARIMLEVFVIPNNELCGQCEAKIHSNN